MKAKKYAVSVETRFSIGKDNWSHIRSLPIFYLHNVYNESDCRKIAKDIVNPFDDDSVDYVIHVYEC
jgi:hypothetical protein